MRVIWRQADNESRMWAIFQSEIENCMTGTIFYLRVLLTSTVFTLLETFLQYWMKQLFSKFWPKALKASMQANMATIKHDALNISQAGSINGIK